LIRAALSTVVAAVAPGNAESLRALLTAGFSPLGSLQLFRRPRLHDPLTTKD
jgi:RimJ/RimL family protein N-acetyltransferase